MFDILNLHTLLGIIAGIIAFVAYIVYIRSILRGESKPNRATWWIWAFMGLIIVASYRASGATTTIWAPIVEFIGPLSIALLSIKYGEGGLEDRTDLVCLVGALVSVVIWLIFDTPVLALLINLIVDALALIPTIKKSYYHPEGENFWAWFGTGTADFLNLFAMTQITFGIALYPVYMLISDLVIIILLSRARIKHYGKVEAHEE